MTWSPQKASLKKGYAKHSNISEVVDFLFKETVEIMDIIKEELMDPSRDCKKFDPGPFSCPVLKRPFHQTGVS
jgi:hypothetical protein